MNPLRPNRLTKKIGLVLIGSSLILTGCSQEKQPQDQVVVYDTTPHWWYFYNGGGSSTHYHSYVSTPSGFGVHSSNTGGFKSTATAVSVRGGFGAHGHAATAGA